MLNALKTYLDANGYKNVCIDFMPATNVDAINLTKWDHTVGTENDGTGTHYIQIQVRRNSYSAALADCTSIFKLLDSGTEEKLIQLTTTTYCIARPRRGPLILNRTDSYITFYCEIAIWGEN